MKKTAIILCLVISLFIVVSCACPRPEPMTNMPPEPELPKAPKTVSPLPEIVSMKDLTLIGFEKNFDANNMTEIPSMWMKLMQVESQIKNRANNTEAWGASYNMDSGGDSFSFTYFAGYEVTDTKIVPEGMVVHVAPASKYAKFSHFGPLENLSQTYTYIYSHWLPTSGYKTGNGNELEMYNQKFNPNGEGSEMFIFVPIQ